MTQTITIPSYLRAVDDWIASVGSEYFDPLTNGCMLSEEVGEVNRLLCREYGQQRYKPGEKPGDFANTLGDELADVLFVLACIANQQGIDLQQAVHRNLRKKSRRDQERYRLPASEEFERAAS